MRRPLTGRMAFGVRRLAHQSEMRVRRAAQQAVHGSATEERLQHGVAAPNSAWKRWLGPPCSGARKHASSRPQNEDRNRVWCGTDQRVLCKGMRTGVRAVESSVRNSGENPPPPGVTPPGPSGLGGSVPMEIPPRQPISESAAQRLCETVGRGTGSGVDQRLDDDAQRPARQPQRTPFRATAHHP